LENIAQDMRMTKNGVVKMRDRLIERKLVEKNRKGYTKTSVMYNSVYRLDKSTYNSVQNRTTEYNGTVQLSGTKINNEINKEKVDKNSKGYKAALAARNALTSKLGVY
jgi:UTP-glucose-1-phosphate uridylyltransferase